MKKQCYIDMGISYGLTPKQIEQVLCQVTGMTPDVLFIAKDISSSFMYEAGQKFYDISQGKQQEYSLQRANFYGRDFFVDERVLIPRNDTELLVQVALKKIHETIDVSKTVYVDVGTGSGCVALSIALEMDPLEFFRSFAIDICPNALEVAEQNKKNFGLSTLQFVQSCLLEYLANQDLQEKRLCITANLPYIKNADFDSMMRTVYEQEPHKALFGGPKTGFELYQKCIKQCFELKHIHKIEQIDMFIEIGYDQKDVSRAFLEELGLSFEYFQDSSNIDRVIHITGF